MKFSAIKGKLNMEYLANDLHALLLTTTVTAVARNI